MGESEKNCWVAEVENVLSSNGFYCVWLQQGVGDENKLLSELKDSHEGRQFFQNWNATIQGKDILSTLQC